MVPSKPKPKPDPSLKSTPVDLGWTLTFSAELVAGQPSKAHYSFAIRDGAGQKIADSSGYMEVTAGVVQAQWCALGYGLKWLVDNYCQPNGLLLKGPAEVLNMLNFNCPEKWMAYRKRCEELIFTLKF